jgi:predicted enzyme related to lactoylglutathione lyase
VPARDLTRLGEPCWNDLMTSDPTRNRDFYSGLFGWHAGASEPEYGDYVTFRRRTSDVAGMAPSPEGSTAGNAWLVYLSVDDVDDTVTAAVAAGGQILQEPFTVGAMGRMAVLADPSGAAVGVWQPIEFDGFRVVAEAGTPIWHELSTRDYDAALAFYTAVFGWEPQVLSDTPEFRYSTVGPEGMPVAGVLDSSAFLPDGVPSHWAVYFGVPDAAEAAARVVELGGAVVREAWDSEFGTFAQVSDTTGAVFYIGSVEPATPTGATPDGTLTTASASAGTVATGVGDNAAFVDAASVDAAFIDVDESDVETSQSAG